MGAITGIIQSHYAAVAAAGACILLACVGIFLSGRRGRKTGAGLKALLALAVLVPLITAGSVISLPLIGNGLSASGESASMKTLEAQHNLEYIAGEQVLYFAQQGRWAGYNGSQRVFADLNWQPPSSRRYAYYCGDDFILPDKTSGDFVYPRPGSSEWPFILKPEVTLADFICMAIGNNDDDPFMDVWAVDRHKRPVHLQDDASDSTLVNIYSGRIDLRDYYSLPEDNKDKLGLGNPYIEVNIPAYRVDLIHDGWILNSYPVAVGMRGYKTPRKYFTMERVEWNPWWYPPDAPWAGEDPHPVGPGPANPLGPVKMILGYEVLIHGTNKPGSIGHSASHGCIRMYPKDAKELAWRVMVLAGARGQIKTPEQYAEHRRRTYKVRLENPVRVHTVYNRLEIRNNTLLIHPDPYRRETVTKYDIRQFLVEYGYSPDALGDWEPQGINGSEFGETIMIPLPKPDSKTDQTASN